MSGEIVYAGIVSRFDAVKGFGFIKCRDLQNDVFVHYSEIQCEGYKKLLVGQKVSFQAKKTPKGVQAVCVIVLDKSSG